MDEQQTKFDVGSRGKVSGLLLVPDDAFACLVFAHGAGLGMAHPFMESVARGLGGHGVATLRYQFPYMEKGSRRPDPPGIAEATVRAAVGEAARLAPTLPIVAGGKSYGGRMTSQAQARQPIPGLRGIVFFGFPLHPAGKPSADRGEHLAQVRLPMLFLQGARDKLADLSLLRPVCERLDGATLHVVEEGDHSFHVPKRTGRSDMDVLAELTEVVAAWARRLPHR